MIFELTTFGILILEYFFKSIDDIVFADYFISAYMTYKLL